MDRRVRLDWVHRGVHSLLCPTCGGPDLHHGGVTVYDRREDEERLHVTRVAPSGTESGVVPHEGSSNPSDRRHGIAIEFLCEHCHHDGDGVHVLTIAQHKGATLVEWRHRADRVRNDADHHYGPRTSDA
jgi:hypothetical protein